VKREEEERREKGKKGQKNCTIPGGQSVKNKTKKRALVKKRQGGGVFAMKGRWTT